MSGEPRGDLEAAPTLLDGGGEWIESRSVPIFDVAAEPTPEAKLGWTLFAVMFGASAPRARAVADPLAALRAWVAEAAGRGARVYRTASGFRVLVTAPPCDPMSGAAAALLERLGADAATRAACRSLGAFRVRVSVPAGRAACHFVEAIGVGPTDEAARLVDQHDRATRAPADLPLS